MYMFAQWGFLLDKELQNINMTDLYKVLLSQTYCADIKP